MKKTLFLFLMFIHYGTFSFMLRNSGRNPPANGQKRMSKKFSINRRGQSRRNCGFRYQGGTAIGCRIGKYHSRSISSNQERNRRPILHLHFELRSGTPIRLALVRQKEIEENFRIKRRSSVRLLSKNTAVWSNVRLARKITF